MFSDRHTVKEADQCKRAKSNKNNKKKNIHIEEEEHTYKTDIGAYRKDVDLKNEVVLIKSEYIDCNSGDTDRSNENNINNEKLYTGSNKINKNVNIETEKTHEVFVYVTEVEIEVEQEANDCDREQIKSEVLEITYEKESNRDSYTSDEEKLIKYLGNKASDDSKDQYKCSKCDYVSHDKHALKRHTYYAHSRGYLNCSYCSYKTLYTTSIQRHINAKHTQTNIFKCSLCNYETFTESNLNRHVNGKHTKHNTFGCPDCDYKTFYKSALLKHINSKHSRKVTFYCSACKYETFSSAALCYHVKVKHNNHLLKCLYCKYETFLKSNLKRHTKAKHPDTV